MLKAALARAGPDSPRGLPPIVEKVRAQRHERALVDGQHLVVSQHQGHAVDEVGHGRRLIGMDPNMSRSFHVDQPASMRSTYALGLQR